MKSIHFSSLTDIILETDVLQNFVFWSKAMLLGFTHTHVVPDWWFLSIIDFGVGKDKPV